VNNSKSYQYYRYLLQRSWKGNVYRRYWLYPRISKLLNGKTLDVGCGIGDLIAYRPNTVGVDINPHTVKWCKSQDMDVNIMEFNKIPFCYGEFDSVIMDNVLEHIYDPAPILSEIYRVLVDEGILVIGVPGTLGYSRDSDHKVFYSKEKMVDTVVNYGFSVHKVFAMPFNYDWLSSLLVQYCVYGVFVKISC